MSQNEYLSVKFRNHQYFVYFQASCVRTAKALARLRGCAGEALARLCACAGSPEPSLVPVWERAVHSVYRACFSETAVNVLHLVIFPFGFVGRMWDLILSDQCLSFYFPRFSFL